MKNGTTKTTGTTGTMPQLTDSPMRRGFVPFVLSVPVVPSPSTVPVVPFSQPTTNYPSTNYQPS